MDKKQRIWLNNTILAAGGGAILSVLMIYAHFTGQSFLTDTQVIGLITIFWMVSLLFVYLIYSGISKRFQDGSLTLPQMTWAVCTSLIFMSVSSAPSNPYYFLVLIVMIFGVFRLPPKLFYRFAFFTIVAIGLQKTLMIHLGRHDMAVVDAFFNWSVFSFSTLILASLCRSTAILRSRLKDRNNQLQEALATKNMFLANMSHELRTPINGIVGMLELLDHTDLDKTQAHYSRIAHSSSMSLLTIVNDILDFSKAEAGRLDIEAIEVNLLTLVEEVAESISYEAQSKNVEVILNTAELKHHKAVHDPVRLRQVLDNIARNAVKFTHEGEIVVEARRHLKQDNNIWFECSISDTGIGIPEEKIESIFDSFSQVDASTTREFGGTGLGLSIVKKLTQLMDGSVTVDSRVGKGSCFTVSYAMPASSHSSQVASAPSLGQFEHFIIIDRNASPRSTIGKQLENWGFTANDFGDIPKALRFLKDQKGNKPLVIMMDWITAKKKGEDFYLHFNNMPQAKDSQLIVLCPLSKISSSVLPKTLSVEATITKPVTASKLLSTFEDLQHTPSHDTGNVQQHIHREKNSDTAPNEQNSKFLLAEDNPINQQVVSGLLEKMGYSCDIAENGYGVIDLLKSMPKTQPYPAILMDCQMPDMDGYEASRRIRRGEAGEHNKSAIIIAITANAMHGDREKCLDAGMNDYITKPIDAAQFQQKIYHVLGQEVETPPEEPRETAASPTTTNSVWDKSGALRRVNGKPERLVKLIGLYMKSAPENFMKLETALKEKRITDAENLAHSVKGSAGNIGAVKLMNTMSSLEQACREQQLDQLAPLFIQAQRDHASIATVFNDFLVNPE